MKNNDRLSGENTKRLRLDRKLVGILSVSALLGICLVITIIIATNTLTGLLGYSSMQTHWTEARKEASLHLISYLRSRDRNHLAKFDSAKAVIDSAHAIRTELAKRNSNHSSVRSKFPHLHIQRRDIDKMIKTFERFQEFADFQRSIRQWSLSDTLVFQMADISNEAQAAISAGTYDSAQKESMVRRVNSLDRELTNREYKITEALSAGTSYLNTIVLVISVSLGLILVITGGFLSFRFLRSLRKWRRSLEIREQEYRSLFEENPNAVFSFSTDGELVQANEALRKLSGYTFDELKGTNYEKFIPSSELPKLRKSFQKVLQGEPQTFESKGITKNGETVYLDLTNLPIYVDDKITGVYGIAQNITDRKRKQKQIEEQLREKTLVLSEMHDRVKNNLALISGLITLQRDRLRREDDKQFLDSISSRIQSIAMVHEQLYDTGKFSKLRIDEYLREFIDNLDKLLNENGLQDDIKLDLNPVSLNISQAVPAALLLNELITNACKYGRTGSGKINIDMHEENGEVVFDVRDNGPGLPEEYSLDNPKSLGLRLVNVLVSQLEGGCQLHRDGGTRYVVTFKNKNGHPESDSPI